MVNWYPDPLELWNCCPAPTSCVSSSLHTVSGFLLLPSWTGIIQADFQLLPWASQCSSVSLTFYICEMGC